MFYNFIIDNGKMKPTGYFPSGKNWHVRYSAGDKNGLMTGVIIQDGIEIAKRETLSTMEELIYFAEAHMAARKEA